MDTFHKSNNTWNTEAVMKFCLSQVLHLRRVLRNTDYQKEERYSGKLHRWKGGTSQLAVDRKATFPISFGLYHYISLLATEPGGVRSKLEKSEDRTLLSTDYVQFVTQSVEEVAKTCREAARRNLLENCIRGATPSLLPQDFSHRLKMDNRLSEFIKGISAPSYAAKLVAEEQH